MTKVAFLIGILLNLPFGDTIHPDKEKFDVEVDELTAAGLDDSPLPPLTL
jgi:hypothetical protein